jgi:hypothetical protein
MRKPIAAVAVRIGDYDDMRVVCDDGSVWELSSAPERCTEDNEFGYFWYQLPAIPGTEVA